MPKTITLDVAAIELGLFYTELMDALDDIVIQETDGSSLPQAVFLRDYDKHPSTTIEYKYLREIQKWLNIKDLPRVDLRKGYRPAIYDRWKKYQDRLVNWTKDWQAMNEPIYHQLYNGNEGYYKKEGFKLPPSFNHMHAWLQRHFSHKAGRRPEYYLTRSFREEFFEDYHRAHTKRAKTVNSAPKPKEKNWHWGLFYWYLAEARIVVNSGDQKETCINFINQLTDRSGDDIANKYVAMKNDKVRLQQIRKEGKASLMYVQSMLTKYGYKTLRKRVQQDVEAVFEKT